ncbi:ABC transporter substrate-binding protein [Bacillus sp. MRMR6]|uniref:ABC transporter substrate-binding protein n=1 Tax=Bacillus sp. MRMR6 TaxID=1928617 RepID=UPI000950C5DC|nr:ABC transporter substrate-binding protein [Bacillus sp. MRMR6]OLS33768.1 hypothetical protein BTR25_24030 [Bacillus sp. MRMR6]
MMKESKRSFLLIITIMLSISLVLVGCVKSSDTTSSTNSEGDNASSTFKIGGLFGLTGGLALLSTADKQGTEMAIEEINAAGGLNINGKKVKVELVSYDPGADPAKLVDYTQRLVNADKVNLIAGHLYSGILEGELMVTDPAKVLVYSSIASTTLLSTGSEYGINLADTGEIEKHALIHLLAEEPEVLEKAGLDADRIKNVKRIAVFAMDEPYGVAADVGTKEAAEKFGYDYAGTVMFPAGTTDFLPYINKLKALKPDMVILNTYSNDIMIPPLKDMLQVGGLDWTKGEILLMGNDVLATQGFIDDAKKEGIDLNGAISFSAIPGTPTSAAQDFYKKAEDKFGPTPMAGYIAASYDATMFVLKGIEKSGTISDTDKMLQGIKSSSYDGLNFTWTVNDVKQLQHPEFIVQIQNDKVVDTGITYGEELYYGKAIQK